MRRTIVLLVAIFAVASSLPGAASKPAQAQVGSRPNVLIIVTDDQRGGLGVMPQVRRYFRRAGTRYDPAFVTTPVCCPSRASIMTGRYAHNHQVKSNSNSEETGALALDHSTTLQAYLQAAGYHTGIVGKFLNPPWELRNNPPFFDEWTTLGGAPGPNDWHDAIYNQNGNVTMLPGYTTTVIRREARSFIKRNAERPWYLYVATKAPHVFPVPAERYADTPIPRWPGNPAVAEKNERDKPPYVRKSDRPLRAGNRIRRAQFRSLRSVDDMVGGIFRTLKEEGTLDNTLAFYISDNGYMWADHGLASKGVPYRASVTVPLLVRWPGRFEGGAIDDRFAANIDIAPTVLDAAGITPTVTQDGRSLLRRWRRDRVLLEFWCNSAKQRCNRWRGLWTRSEQYTEYREEGETLFREYYDHEQDPWQLRNLLGDGEPENPPRTPALERQVARDSECVGATCP
jgi:arylsulfatase A-like enzyme